MVAPLIVGGIIAGASYLAGRFGGGGTGGIEAVSRNKLPINLFGSQTLDESTNSNQFTDARQTTVQKTYSPVTYLITKSPNASLSASTDLSPNLSASQTLSPQQIPTGAGGQSSTPIGSASAPMDFKTIALLGAFGLIAFGIFQENKK